jgi:hypothetical protein
MKDKRLLCWLVGTAALCCGFIWTQTGRADSSAKPQPRTSSMTGVGSDHSGDGLLFQRQPKTVTRNHSASGDEDEGKPTEPAAGLRKLTSPEINRIRYMELRGMRMKTEQPDRVSCKVPRETVDDFLLEMQGHADFQGERARLNFHKLTAPQKLHAIAQYKGAAYADKVEITSDPEVFLEFKKRVMPIVSRGCGTLACHGASERDVGRFVLYNDPKKTAGTTYANFLMLNEISYNGHRLIDRAQPENSLLLTYMLPKEDIQPDLRHPGNVKVEPIFRSSGPRGFRRIRDWISSLKHPADDYGVHLYPVAVDTEGPGDVSKPTEPAPSTQPAKGPEPGPQKKPEMKPQKPGPQPAHP